MVAGKIESVSHVHLFASSCTIAHQAPLSMKFPRYEYWRWLPLLFSNGSSGNNNLDYEPSRIIKFYQEGLLYYFTLK